MRVKDKTSFASCAKMTDQMNGDTPKEQKLIKESDDSNSSLCPKENSDLNTSSLPKISCKAVDYNIKDSEKDDISYPNSPGLYSDEFNSSGGGRLKFFKDGKFILELSHRKDGEKTCWIPVPKKTYWPMVGTPRQDNSTSLSVSDDNSSVQSSPWQRDHSWKQTMPRANLARGLEYHFVHPPFKPRYFSKEIQRKRKRPFDFSPLEESNLVKVKVKPRDREGIVEIIKFLWERVLNICKLEPGIVSPRKRILRELERVTLEEASKRQRAKPPSRNTNSHSISSILAKEDDSVLRNLLRSPSPENVRSFIPSSSFVPHPVPTGFPPSPPFHGPMGQTYRVPNSAHSPTLWSLHYPVSSPPLSLPLYPVQSYSPSWPRIHRPITQETSSDIPLNLSKNAG